MNSHVLWKLVPDTVDEFVVAPGGTSLVTTDLRFKLADADEHALEEALLLKERHGGTVTVVALEAPEVDEALFMALAKGADRAVKIAVDQTRLGVVATAKVFAAYFATGSPAIAPDSLVLSGSQADDDLDGVLAACLAESWDLPYVGVVCAVAPADGHAIVLKEFAGGVRGEFDVSLPAVLGIQSAEAPPRYVPVARLRAAMKSAAIETVDLATPETAQPLVIERMYKPEVAGRAQMLEGSTQDVAEQVVEIMAQHNLL